MSQILWKAKTLPCLAPCWDRSSRGTRRHPRVEFRWWSCDSSSVSLLKWCYDLWAVEKKGCHFKQLVFSKSVHVHLCLLMYIEPVLTIFTEVNMWLQSLSGVNLVMDSSVFYSIFVFFFSFLFSLFILTHSRTYILKHLTLTVLWFLHHLICSRIQSRPTPPLPSHLPHPPKKKPEKKSGF